MSKFINSTFSHTRVELDFNTFVNCLFQNCILEYKGLGPVEMSGNVIKESQWLFSGPAENTIKFLTALYNGLGPDGIILVEEIFQRIKEGNIQSSQSQESPLQQPQQTDKGLVEAVK